MVYALRTADNPLVYANAVREIVRRADSRIPVTNMQTRKVEIDRAMNQEILFARLSNCFAILALIISGVGLYGTMAYAVSRRTWRLASKWRWARRAAP